MYIKEYSNFLSKEEHEYVEKTVYGNSWGFLGCSIDSNEGFTIFYMDLSKDIFFTEKMLAKIEKISNKKFDLMRVYANGQTYGLSGSLHKDHESDDDRYKTFLYYVNPWWNYVWGGETIFVENDNTYKQSPIPNTGLLFTSSIPHAGLEPTRHCKELRVTVAFKLMEINGEM